MNIEEGKKTPELIAACETVTELARQAINILPKQVAIQGIIHSYGSTYVTQQLEELSVNLIDEITPTVQEHKFPYISLRDVTRGKVETGLINGVETTIYQHQSRGVTKAARDTVNLVFPCRNSRHLFNDSLELLVSEITKSKSTSFNVVIQINNTSDDTAKVILQNLESRTHLPDNIKLYVIESDPSEVISLPGSLNLGYKFLKDKTQGVGDNQHLYFSFWDDELKPTIPTDHSIFESNMRQLHSLPSNKAISGYMIDTRTNVSRWHELCKGFSSDIRFVHKKPYLHGGAGTIMKFTDYPVIGIKNGGIADTDLSEHLLHEYNFDSLKSLSHQDWPIRTNPDAPIYHPIEDNILNWTIKYLMYQLAWEHTFTSLEGRNNGMGSLWGQRIDENRHDFHEELRPYLESLPILQVIERAFMRSYYLTIKSMSSKFDTFNKLKSLRQRSLIIREK
jgi:hypothetical protein